MNVFDCSPQTGSSKDAQRDVRRQRPHKGCWETAVTAEDDEEAEGGRTQSARLLSGEETSPRPLRDTAALTMLMSTVGLVSEKSHIVS